MEGFGEARWGGRAEWMENAQKRLKMALERKIR